jgi:hypothetical protein
MSLYGDDESTNSSSLFKNEKNQDIYFSAIASCFIIAFWSASFIYSLLYYKYNLFSSPTFYLNFIFFALLIRYIIKGFEWMGIAVICYFLFSTLFLFIDKDNIYGLITSIPIKGIYFAFASYLNEMYLYIDIFINIAFTLILTSYVYARNDTENSKRMAITVYTVLLVCGSFYLNNSLKFTNNDKGSISIDSTQLPKNKVSPKEITESYSDYRIKIIDEGWSPYLRSNSFSNVNTTFPENQFCYEDSCISEFISDSHPNNVRTVNYLICSTDRYYQCPNKPNNFMQIESDEIVLKEISDAEFMKIKKQFSN